jgi:FtsH-binding integral membrane protein
MRAFFAGGVNKMHISWAVEGLPMLLHLSLFLFFGGLAIFLFNVDREVFGYVICWIGLFLMVYGIITVLPFIRRDSPYNSPLSGLAWFLYASINHVTFKILAFITLRSCYEGLGGPISSDFAKKWLFMSSLSNLYVRAVKMRNVST